MERTLMIMTVLLIILDSAVLSAYSASPAGRTRQYEVLVNNQNINLYWSG